MKKTVLLLLLCMAVSLGGCFGKQNNIKDIQETKERLKGPGYSETADSTNKNDEDTPSQGKNIPEKNKNKTNNTKKASPVPSYLEKYNGTWYGYGTIGNEYVNSPKTLTFLDASRFIFNEESYIMTDEYTAEKIAPYKRDDIKTILEFGTNGQGGLALRGYDIKKSDGSCASQLMDHYREGTKPDSYTFIKGAEGSKATSKPSSLKSNTAKDNRPQQKTPESEVSESKPAPDMSTQPAVQGNKATFQQRYNELEVKEIDQSHQAAMNKSSYALYQEWDLLLNDIYQYLKATKNADEFKAIESDEVRWIKEKEDAIAQSRAPFTGGTMAPLAGNTTAIQYTQERCAYLMSLIG